MVFEPKETCRTDKKVVFNCQRALQGWLCLGTCSCGMGLAFAVCWV